MPQNSKMSRSDRALSKWSFVIIDDTPDNLALAKMALRFHGAEVYTAQDGMAGLELLRNILPTAILLDIRMPRMDGWTVFKSLRENPATQHIPIIAITAYAMEGDREQILSAGFDGYISKPFDMFNFAGQIEDLVIQALEKRPITKDATI